MKSARVARRWLISIVAVLIVLGTADMATAQKDEYNEWQDSLRDAQRQHLKYLAKPTRARYNEWEDARMDAQKQYMKYQRAFRNESYRSDDLYPGRRNVIVVGQTQPVRRTVVVAGNGNGRYVNGTKVIRVNGNGKYVNGTKVAYVNGNGKYINGNGRATCGTGTAYLNGNRSVMIGNGFDEYEDWAAAEREVLREHREFINNPTDDNFAGWKESQIDACREYAEYRAAAPLASSTVAYTDAVYTAPVVRTTYVRRRAPVRRVRAKAKRCVCR